MSSYQDLWQGHFTLLENYYDTPSIVRRRCVRTLACLIQNQVFPVDMDFTSEDGDLINTVALHTVLLDLPMPPRDNLTRKVLTRKVHFYLWYLINYYHQVLFETGSTIRRSRYMEAVPQPSEINTEEWFWTFNELSQLKATMAAVPVVTEKIHLILQADKFSTNYNFIQ